MNKEYRGKIKYNGNHYFAGEWVTGFYIEDESGTSFIIDNEEDEYGNRRLQKVEVIPETVGKQLSILYDDGTPVFEGDILSMPEMVDRGDRYKDPFIGKVFWEDKQCHFYVWDDSGVMGESWFFWESDGPFKKIGTIHDKKSVVPDMEINEDPEVSMH